MAKRLNVRVSDELGLLIEKWSKELGVTQSQLGGMAIQAGIGALLRAVKPVESVPAEIMAKIVHEVQKLEGNLEDKPDK